jgi:hypothetical protein
MGIQNMQSQIPENERSECFKTSYITLVEPGT